LQSGLGGFMEVYIGDGEAGAPITARRRAGQDDVGGERDEGVGAARNPDTGYAGRYALV